MSPALARLFEVTVIGSLPVHFSPSKNRLNKEELNRL